MLHRASELVGLYEQGNEPLDSIKGREFFTSLVTVSFSMELVYLWWRE